MMPPHLPFRLDSSLQIRRFVSACSLTTVVNNCNNTHLSNIVVNNRRTALTKPSGLKPTKYMTELLKKIGNYL
jgi:hypothetical protein